MSGRVDETWIKPRTPYFDTMLNYQFSQKLKTFETIGNLTFDNHILLTILRYSISKSFVNLFNSY